MSLQYDERFKEYPPYEATPMRHMYQHVASMIPRLYDVVDLGCGSGYLASALKEAGSFRGRYIGYDLSPVAVDMAVSALSDLQMQLVDNNPPQWEFHVADLQESFPSNKKAHRTVYACFEVLEHIDFDVELVKHLPARARFIFSVPNYWSDLHVRIYNGVGDALDRYGHLLEFDGWRIFPTKQRGAAIHLYDSYRRADSW